MHNGFVDMRGEKMSKSLGNIVRAHEALEMTTNRVTRGETVRMWMLSTHYRQPIGFSADRLSQAQDELDDLYERLTPDPSGSNGDVEPDPEFVEALLDDLNTPKARARLFVLAREAKDPKAEARLLASASLLGLLHQDPREAQPGFLEAIGAFKRQEIEGLIAERRAAREARDFARADQIRRNLFEEDQIILEDRPDGTTGWRRA
jgi:cysteinyl-tRNA synthetase